MTERGARYLLRFDDLCPTMDRAGWASFERLVREFQIRPILAIVPENQDPDLRQDEADERFWERMRSLQESGAAIALHGYRHRCVSDGRSLLPPHRLTEFAGVPAATQSAWIEQGTRIFREHGLEPKVFVAPRHGLDHGTLQALRAAGITAISDGFGRRPTVHHGIAWIPQQLWGPARKKSGVWTICIHSNQATDMQVRSMAEFLREHQAECIGVEEAMRLAKPSWAGISVQTWMTAQYWRIRLKRAVRLKSHWLRRD